jgi:hypothetical protein
MRWTMWWGTPAGPSAGMREVMLLTDLSHENVINLLQVVVRAACRWTRRVSVPMLATSSKASRYVVHRIVSLRAVVPFPTCPCTAIHLRTDPPVHHVTVSVSRTQHTLLAWLLSRPHESLRVYEEALGFLPGPRCALISGPRASRAGEPRGAHAGVGVRLCGRD